MHLLVEVLFVIDGKVSVNSSKVLIYYCNQSHTWHTSASCRV